MTQEEVFVALSKHEQSIKALQHQINEIKNMTKELQVMNTSLTELTSELKHTNENMTDHSRRLDALEAVPKNRLEKVIGSVLSALASGAAGYLLAQLIG